MNHRPFKEAIYGELARVAKAAANPHRLELLDLLAQGERSVEDLAGESALSIANASQHLQSLRDAHLVASRKQGLRVFYRLSDPSVYQLVQAIRKVADLQLAEVDRIMTTFLSDRKALEAVTLAELHRRLNEDDFVLLDVRPALEYEQGHIARAQSMPISELEARLGELPKDREIVAYCRGPYCVFADEAVQILRGQGYTARRLQEGYPDWQVAGYATSAAQDE